MKKYFVYYLILITCCLLYTKVNAQVNKVPNASFEDLKQGYFCGVSVLFQDYAVSWFQPTEGTPDLFSKKCADMWGTSVPNNNFGYQYPRSGENYLGALLLASNNGTGVNREYISTKLKDTLTIGKVYCVRLFANLANTRKYATSNIGVCFSIDTLRNNDPNPALKSHLFNYTPQLTNSWNNLISDTLNWMLLEWQYQATGNEAFITIGNFKHDSVSNYAIVNTSATYNQSYIHFDDISIIDISTPAHAGRDTTIALGDSVFIGRTPEIGLNDDCFWFINGNPIDTVAGMWVAPDTTTTYILKQDICGTVNYDTVTVTVQPSGNYKLGLINDDLRVYPNPAQTSISIACKNASSQAMIQICDVLGSIVLQQALTKEELNISELSRGIYLLKLIDGNKVSLARFIKE
jgi:hypothetical protein